MSPSLLAYIPTLNQRHIDWLKKYQGSYLFLIPQEMAERFLPRLARNMAAVPTEITVVSINANKLVGEACVFDPDNWNPRLATDDSWLGASGWKEWVLPDEDISHLVAEKYLEPAGAIVQFEMIWARHDMTAVHKNQPVITDVTVSSSSLDVIRIELAGKLAAKSPDWWRQIGAVAWRGETCLACAYNTHMPNEYETFIFGDPRLNVDAGQPGKYCVLHAERAVIALCAKKGVALKGASLYVTTFPCEDCAREIAFSGISKLFFRDGFSVLNGQETLRSYGVEIVQVVQDAGSA